MRTLLNLVVKELLQLKRDPKILPILFVAPVVQLTLLSYAATTDVRAVYKAVLRDHLGVAGSDLESRVFPASRAAAPINDLIRT